MAKLQAIIRAIAAEFSSLSKLFEKLNSAFHKDILPNSFASMVYVEIEDNNDNLEYVNAGHLPPIVIKDGKLTKLEKGDVALGLVGNSIFNSEKLNLRNDDYFIAFSDGVTEARNHVGDFYGLERVIHFIDNATYHSPEQLGQKLLFQVESFIGSAKAHDDLSIVILKREVN